MRSSVRHQELLTAHVYLEKTLLHQLQETTSTLQETTYAFQTTLSMLLRHQRPDTIPKEILIMASKILSYDNDKTSYRLLKEE